MSIGNNIYIFIKYFFYYLIIWVLLSIITLLMVTLAHLFSRGYIIMFNTIKTFIKKYSHATVFLYAPFYMMFFNYLEKTVRHNYFIVHSRFDDFIPFNEYFIVPYLLWFLYVAVTMSYFFLKDREEFFKYCIMIAIGMSICLLICWLFPNGTDFRPHIDANKNWASFLVSKIYSVDTNTNVFPSIHVYNSIATHIAIRKSEHLAKYKLLSILSLILTISICLSTVFLKQHSIIDVIGGMALAYLMYILVYVNIPTGISEEDKKLLSEKIL